MAEAPSAAVPDDLRQLMETRYNRTQVADIELGRVRDYLLAMDEPAEINQGDVAPPLFLLTCGRTRRPQPDKGTAVKAGDEYQFHAPVRVGDRVSIAHRLVGIEPKQGKNGIMFLVTAEATFRNQRNEIVCVQRTRTFRWGL